VGVEIREEEKKKAASPPVIPSTLRAIGCQKD
jgi:hypothetical protein